MITEGNKPKRQRFPLTLIILLNWCKNMRNVRNGGYYENREYMGFYGLVDGPCGNRDIHFACHLLFLFEG